MRISGYLLLFCIGFLIIQPVIGPVISLLSHQHERHQLKSAKGKAGCKHCNPFVGCADCNGFIITFFHWGSTDILPPFPQDKAIGSILPGYYWGAFQPPDQA
jgi:hypothetical protein